MSKNKFKNIANEKHYGFAITLEVMATLVMMCIFLNMTLYILRVMNVQRYMNTVMTATAVQASRWGGTYTNAYKNNVNSNETILDSAQGQLNAIALSFNPKITGNPGTISSDGQGITIRIDYSLPSVFSTMSKDKNVKDMSNGIYDKTKVMHMSVTIKSIMKAGKLL